MRPRSLRNWHLVWTAWTAAVLGVACFSEASGDSEASATGVSSSETSTTAATGPTSSADSSSSDGGVSDTSSGSSGTDGPMIACGNGVPDPGESCDDGNAEQGDGCNSDCRESGALLWEWQPAESIDRDAAWAVEVSPTRDIAVAGWMTDEADDPRAWVASLDVDGALRWDNDALLPGPGRAFGMTLVPEGVVVVGDLLMPAPPAHAFVAIVDGDGELLDGLPAQTSAALSIAYDAGDTDVGPVAVGGAGLAGSLDAASLRFDPEEVQLYANNGAGDDVFRRIAHGGRHDWLAGWSANDNGRVDGLLVRRVDGTEDVAPALVSGESDTRIYALALDASGRPIVGGTVRDASVVGPAILARYDSQGSLLEATSTLAFRQPWASILAVAIAANGDVVVGGAAGATSDDAQLVVARIAPDLATQRWIRLLGDSGAHFVADVAIDPASEEIVAVGVRAEADPGDIWVGKFTP